MTQSEIEKVGRIIFSKQNFYDNKWLVSHKRKDEIDLEFCFEISSAFTVASVISIRLLQPIVFGIVSNNLYFEKWLKWSIFSYLNFM